MKSQNTIAARQDYRRQQFLTNDRYPQGFNRLIWGISPLIRTKHEFVNGFLRPKSSNHIKQKLLQFFYGWGNILQAALYTLKVIAEVLFFYVMLFPILLCIGLPGSALLTLGYWIQGDPIKPRDLSYALHIKSMVSNIIGCLFIPISDAIHTVSLFMRGSIQIITTPLALTLQPLWQGILTLLYGGYRTFSEKNTTQRLVQDGFKEMEAFVLSLMNDTEKAILLEVEGLSWQKKLMDKLTGGKLLKEKKVAALTQFINRLNSNSNIQEQTEEKNSLEMRKDIGEEDIRQETTLHDLISQYNKQRSQLKQWVQPRYTLHNIFNELAVTAHKASSKGQAFGKNDSMSLTLINHKNHLANIVNFRLEPSINDENISLDDIANYCLSPECTKDTPERKLFMDMLTLGLNEKDENFTEPFQKASIHYATVRCATHQTEDVTVAAIQLRTMYLKYIKTFDAIQVKFTNTIKSDEKTAITFKKGHLPQTMADTFTFFKAYGKASGNKQWSDKASETESLETALEKAAMAIDNHYGFATAAR